MGGHGGTVNGSTEETPRGFFLPSAPLSVESLSHSTPPWKKRGLIYTDDAQLGSHIYDLVRLGLTKSESQALTSVVFLKSGPWLKKVISDSEPWLLVMTSHSHDFFRPKKSEPWLDIAWDFSWGMEPIWENFDPFSADFRVFCVFSPLSAIDPLLYDAFWVSWLSPD